MTQQNTFKLIANPQHLLLGELWQGIEFEDPTRVRNCLSEALRIGETLDAEFSLPFIKAIKWLAEYEPAIALEKLSIAWEMSEIDTIVEQEYIHAYFNLVEQYPLANPENAKAILENIAYLSNETQIQTRAKEILFYVKLSQADAPKHETKRAKPNRSFEDIYDDLVNEYSAWLIIKEANGPLAECVKNIIDLALDAQSAYAEESCHILSEVLDGLDPRGPLARKAEDARNYIISQHSLSGYMFLNNIKELKTQPHPDPSGSSPRPEPF